MAQGIPARLSAREGRRFGLTVGTAFAILAGIIYWRDHTIPSLVFGTLAALLLLGGLLLPTRLGPIQRGWMAFAHALSRVTTPIFMGVVYFGVVTPIGLLVRVFGRNPMVHREAERSFWKSRDGIGGQRSNLLRQF